MEDISCCSAKDVEKSSRLALWSAFVINLAMFFVEQIYGWVAESRALLGDSVDMLGDSGFYLITILAIGKTPLFGARAAYLKGVSMAFFALLAIISGGYRFLNPQMPDANIIGVVGALALCANFICAAILMKFRDRNINMRSVWLCTRNDVIANFGVLIAAVGVYFTNSSWPDLVIGIVIGLIILKSSLQILKESKEEVKRLLPT